MGLRHPAAAVVQGQFKLDTPLNVEAMTTPAGAYRDQFAENLVATSMAGTFAATAATGAAPVTTTTPAATRAPAASLDPSKFDPKTGSPLDESLPDVCVLVPLDTVKAASGHADTKQGPVHLSAFIDRSGGDAWAVDGSWVVFVGVGSGIPLTIRGATTATMLAAAVGNLPK